MPPKGPEITPLIIEGPEDGIASVRDRVYAELRELPLASGKPGAPILIARGNVHRIVDLVTRIDGAQLIGTPEAGYRLKLKVEEKAAEPPVVLRATPPATDGLIVRVAAHDVEVPPDDDDDDDPGDRTWVTSAEWGSHFEQESRAKSIAYEINRPARGRKWPKVENRVTVKDRNFHYKGESISITTPPQGGKDRVLTIAEVRRWKSQVDERRRRR